VLSAAIWFRTIAQVNRIRLEDANDAAFEAMWLRPDQNVDVIPKRRTIPSIAPVMTLRLRISDSGR
jgi:hypothetical protein